MISWPVVCLPKDQGGLGILDLDIMNIPYYPNGSGSFSMKKEFSKVF
jgi:hypothetical protein